MKLPLAVVALTLSCVVARMAEPPAPAAGALERTVYKVRPGDHVSIVVYGDEKLGVRGAVVDAKGEVRMAGVSEPLIAAGLSVVEIQAMVESRFKRSGVESPRVAVVILNYANQRTESGHESERDGVRLIGISPPVIIPDDPIRSDAKLK